MKFFRSLIRGCVKVTLRLRLTETGSHARRSQVPSDGRIPTRPACLTAQVYTQVSRILSDVLIFHTIVFDLIYNNHGTTARLKTIECVLIIDLHFVLCFC